MRHFLAVRPHSIGVAERAEPAPLVPLARLTQRLRSLSPSAIEAAIAVAAVAPATQIEDLPAFGPAADDEAQRLHSDSPASKKWTSSPNRATNGAPVSAQRIHE